MPSPEMCTLTGVVLGPSGEGLAAVGTSIACTVLSLPGYAYEASIVTFYVDANGELKTAAGQPAKLAQGATVHIRGKVRGFTNGANVLIPAVGEYEFRLLAPGTGTIGVPPASQASVTAEVARATNAEEGLQEQIDDIDVSGYATVEALTTEADARQSADAIFTQTITEDTTLDVGDALRALILIDSSEGDVTATLQPAADVPHREITFKKIADDNLAIIDGDGSETIDGSLVFNLEMMNQTVKVVPVGSEWYIA